MLHENRLSLMRRCGARTGSEEVENDCSGEERVKERLEQRLLTDRCVFPQSGGDEDDHDGECDVA